MNKVLVYAIILVALCGVASAALSDGLIHYYTFDEVSGSLEDSIGTADATLVQGAGGASYGASGKVGTGIQFTAGAVTPNDYITYGIPVTPPGSNGWTILWWMNMTSADSNFLCGNVTGNSLCHYTNSNGDVLLQTNSGFGTSSFGVWADTGWHLLGVRSDPNFFFMEENMPLMSDHFDGSTYNMNFPDSGSYYQPMYLPSYNVATGGHHFNGVIDEVAIWNRTLSDSEISQFMAYGNNGTRPFTETPPSPPSSSYYYPINCSYAPIGMPIAINGSAGVTFGADKVIIWANCQPDLKLNFTTGILDFEVWNATSKVPYEIEETGLSTSPSYLPTQVWDSDYSSVYHMNNVTPWDAGGSVRNCTIYGGSVKNGKIGNSVAFDGTTTLGVCDGDETFGDASTSFTMEVWSNTTRDDSANPHLLNTRDGINGIQIIYAETQYMYMQDTAVPINTKAQVGSDWLQSGVYFFTVAGRDNVGARPFIWLDGTNFTNTSNFDSGDISTSSNFEIGGRESEGASRYWLGEIDEVRFSTVSRESWIPAQYNNIQNIDGYGTTGVLIGGGGNVTPPSPPHPSVNYTFMYQVNCTNVPTGMPVMIGGGQGVTLNNTQQYVWTNCGNNITMYVNNQTDYIVADSAGLVPWEVEEVTGVLHGTSYLPEQVWDSNYAFVYHMNNLTQLDSGGSGKSCSYSGAPSITSGSFADKLSFDGIDDKLTCSQDLTFGTGDLAYELFFSTTASVAANPRMLSTRNPTYGNELYFQTDGRTTVQGRIQSTANIFYRSTTNTSLNNGASYWFSGERVSGTGHVYLNGLQVDGSSGVNAGDIHGGSFSMGWSQNTGTFMAVTLDEVRASYTSRSSWQVAEYQNSKGTMGYASTGVLSYKNGSPAITPPPVCDKTFNWTTQENPTNYTELNGNWGWDGPPRYPYSRFFDSDPNTYATGCNGCAEASGEFEYAKPQYSTNASIWYVKSGYFNQNVSIPEACWNAYTDRIVFYVTTEQASTYGQYFSCYNGTGYTIILSANGGVYTSHYVYTERMYWRIETPPLLTATFQSSYNLTTSPILPFVVTVNGLFQNASTDCVFNFNTTGVSCSGITTGFCNSTRYSTCIVSTLIEKSFSWNITCANGLTTPQYNFYIDSNSNPYVILDLIEAYNPPFGGSFAVTAQGYNWVEPSTCAIVWNDTLKPSCLLSAGGTSFPKIYNCTYSLLAERNYLAYLNCNGTSLYKNINSPSVETWIDNVQPAVLVNYFLGGNNSYFNKNIKGQFNYYDSNLWKINATIDGVTIFTQQDINSSYYNYTLDHYVGNLPAGLHHFEIFMFDSHTKKALAKQWDIEKPLLNDYVMFTVRNPNNRKVENKITVTSLDKDGILNPFSTDEGVDRFTFDAKFNSNKAKYNFRVSATEPIHIIHRPDTKWGDWIVSGTQWLDFYTVDKNVKVKITRVDAYTVDFEVRGHSNGKNQHYESIGELNEAYVEYYFNVYNATVTYVPTIIEGQSQTASLDINYGTSPTPTYTLGFSYNDISNRTFTNYNTTGHLIFNASTFYSPIETVTTTETGVWNFTTPTETNFFSFNQTVEKIAVSLYCANASYTRAITLHGKDEQDDANITFDVNIHFTLWTDNELLVSDMPLELRNQSSYDLCIYPNSTIYQMSAILEYMASGYAPRKYYLYNTTLSSSHQDLFLYLLPTASSTEIIAYVLDATTTDPVEGAYIRVLRYYPGRADSYAQVELAKTDNQGRTIIKQTVVDVFYKYIIEYPPGTVRLDTEVQKVLTGTKTFLINLLSSTGQDVWNRVQHMSTRVSCTESDQTCRLTWANEGLTAKTATLNVYLDNGYNRVLLFNQSISSSAGTIAYLVPNYENNTRYVAEAQIEGQDNILYPAGRDEMITEDNPIRGYSFRMAMLFPYLLLVIVIGAAFLDIGTVGVVIGSLVALIGGWMVGVLPFNFGMSISIVVMFIVMIFKLSRE